MADIYDVIQAFADGEPVDPVELEQALADPDGRAHLVDIVVLRKLVKQSVASAVADVAPVVRRPWQWLAAAAAVVVIAGSGYFVGEHRSLNQPVATPPATEAVTNVTPPSPTVVIKFQPGVDWTERGGN